MVVYILERGFMQLRLGFGSSIGVFMFVCILIISLFQFRSFASNLNQDAKKSVLESGVPAFNVNNLEQIRAIMEGANELNSPVICNGC